VSVATTLTVIETLPLSVKVRLSVELGVSVKVRLTRADNVNVISLLGLPLKVADSETESVFVVVFVVDGSLLSLGVSVGIRVRDTVGLSVKETVPVSTPDFVDEVLKLSPPTVLVSVGTGVMVSVMVIELESEWVCSFEGDLLRVTVFFVWDRLEVPSGESETESVTVMEGVMVLVSTGVGVEVPSLLSESDDESDKVGDSDSAAVTVLDEESVREIVGESLPGSVNVGVSVVVSVTLSTVLVNSPVMDWELVSVLEVVGEGLELWVELKVRENVGGVAEGNE
jgi:hypothetical protein